MKLHVSPLFSYIQISSSNSANVPSYLRGSKQAFPSGYETVGRSEHTQFVWDGETFFCFLLFDVPPRCCSSCDEEIDPEGVYYAMSSSVQSMGAVQRSLYVPRALLPLVGESKLGRRLFKKLI